jgi:hypothetical protein
LTVNYYIVKGKTQLNLMGLGEEMFQKHKINNNVVLIKNNHFSKLSKVSALFTAVIFLVGCGGGGGGSSNQNSLTPTSFASSSSSVAPITPPISYIVTGPCAEGSAYTLTITDGHRINATHLEEMVCNFFSTYPKVVALLNPNASKNIEFSFDPNSPYIAAAYGTKIVYLTSYLLETLHDTDIVVHETTHAAQAELVPVMPRWIIEGTADFVRDLYGLDSKDVWSIPTRYISGRHYSNGYGDAASFFRWVDAVYRQNELPVAAAISRSMLAEPAVPYSDELWVRFTGKKLDVLWNEYVNFPVKQPFATGVTVYNGKNFTGNQVTLERGNYDLLDLLAMGVTDNQIASIKVPEGYKLKAYVDVNFAGEQMVFTENTTVLNEAMALKISSVIVE